MSGVSLGPNRKNFGVRKGGTSFGREVGVGLNTGCVVGKNSLSVFDSKEGG